MSRCELNGPEWTLDDPKKLLDKMEAGMGEPNAPKCNVCNHHHEQGVKCPVCGHTGKSRVFQLFRNRPLMNVFSVRGFDCMKRNPSIHNLDRGLWAITKILRGRLFAANKVELPTDPSARHLIAYIGDAPIGTARWRVVTENGAQGVEIDLFGILEAKRQQGYGKQLLQHLLEDMSTLLLDLGASCEGVAAYVPDYEFTVASLKLFAAAGFQLDAQRYEREGVLCSRVFMLPPT